MILLMVAFSADVYGRLLAILLPSYRINVFAYADVSCMLWIATLSTAATSCSKASEGINFRNVHF